jgi:drug/metabolite transporter (DMT)-like permease
MIFLILSMTATILLLLVFKSFKQFNIQTFPAIVFNYWVCVITGSIITGRQPINAELFDAIWLPSAAILGALFITGFYAVGITVQRFGLAVSSIMQKMSLILSVPFGIFMFSDSFSALQTVGLLLAVLAIVLTNLKFKSAAAPQIKPDFTIKTTDSSPSQPDIEIETRFGHWVLTTVNNDSSPSQPDIEIETLIESPKPAEPTPAFYWIFPIISLCCSGTIESVLRYAEQFQLGNNSQTSATFTLVSFGIAGIFGSLFLLVHQARGKIKIHFRDFLAGIFLGVPNYFAIYFLLMAFEGQDKSVILPILSVSIITISVFLGYVLFRETLTRINLVGISMAIAAILLISLAG